MQQSISGSDSMPTTETPSEALASLRRFARARAIVDRCELCAAELAPEHQHLLDSTSRQIACACDACAILFSDQQDGKFLRIPRRIARLDGFSFGELQWQSMMLPINLAIFVRQPDGGTRVMYPSPAGPMESLISMPAWDALCAGESALAAMKPEVEALLVNRISEVPAYFIVPIDACYRLIGLIRTPCRLHQRKSSAADRHYPRFRAGRGIHLSAPAARPGKWRVHVAAGTAAQARI